MLKLKLINKFGGRTLNFEEETWEDLYFTLKNNNSIKLDVNGDEIENYLNDTNALPNWQEEDNIWDYIYDNFSEVDYENLIMDSLGLNDYHIYIEENDYHIKNR